MSKAMWLEERIIWDPVDGQHILQACYLTKSEFEKWNMTESEYRTTFSTRKARFVVYDDPMLYIEASTRINAQQHERKFYTTVSEDL